MVNWIASNEELQELCQQLETESLLAVDTEFIRTNTFYPQLALIQLSDGNTSWLVDVLEIDKWQPLKLLLEAPSRKLLFHACAEDLEVLNCKLSICPQNIFDTQIAAGIANVGYSMGYARLVNKLLDVELDKHETRSDWLARPLTDEQKRYAIEDVAYLHTLHKLLSDELTKLRREEWCFAETASLLQLVESRDNCEDYYLRVKGAWQLNSQSLAALKRLCYWRETMARKKDKPRSRILKDSILLEIAIHMPTKVEQLYRITDMYPRTVKRCGERVIQEVANSISDPVIERLPQPIPKAAGTTLKEIRGALNQAAEDAAIPQEFLCNKKELEAILRSGLGGEILWPTRITTGWRETLVKPVIEEVLKNNEIGIKAS